MGSALQDQRTSTNLERLLLPRLHAAIAAMQAQPQCLPGASVVVSNDASKPTAGCCGSVLSGQVWRVEHTPVAGITDGAAIDQHFNPRQADAILERPALDRDVPDTFSPLDGASTTPSPASRTALARAHRQAEQQERWNP